MKPVKFFTAILFIALFFGNFQASAQHFPKGAKVANVKRPNDLKVSSSQLSDFYNALFSEEIEFQRLKLVKSELAYYLLADCSNNGSIYAFELKQKGKKVCLDPYSTVQSCSEGELSLKTFLEIDGKLSGCKLGAHKIQARQKG